MSTAKQTDPFDSFDDADDGFTQNYEAADALDLGDPFEDLPEIDLEPLTPAGGLHRQALTAGGFAHAEPAADSFGDDLGAVSIPRIGIHFFPDGEGTLQACDTAALDRRMARAQSLVRRGGIEEAHISIS